MLKIMNTVMLLGYGGENYYEMYKKWVTIAITTVNFHDQVGILLCLMVSLRKQFLKTLRQ